MDQSQSGISNRLETLYRRAAAAVGSVERQYGANEEQARLAEADFFRSLIEGEEMAERNLSAPPRRHLDRGLVQVYTGDGKGKTTAAVGLALRAVGSGLRVCVVQFMKGGSSSGEVVAANHVPGLKVIRTGSSYDASQNQADSPILRAEARSTFEKARLLALGGEYDLIILDEMNVVLAYQFVETGEVLDLIKSKPETLELVFTGRHAPDELIETADLVTEMKEIKHPASAGVMARRGVEF
jgi:cob(I)alamin adenosyltransferase